MPATQSVHADAVDAVEYLPTAHAIQVLAPVPVPVFVIEPAAQLMHADSVDAVEYIPAAHGVQELAPAAVPVFVIDPLRHTWQNACALEAW